MDIDEIHFIDMKITMIRNSYDDRNHREERGGCGADGSGD